MFIVNYILIVIGPVLSAIGMIKYRTQLFEIFCRKYYIYHTIQLNVNQKLNLSIPLVEEFVDEATSYWKVFLNNTGEGKFLRDYYSVQGSLNEKLIIDKIN